MAQTSEFQVNRPPLFEERTYRNQMIAKDLFQFNVTEFESDLQIFAKTNLEAVARSEIIKYRTILQNYIIAHPDFLTSLTPVKATADADDIIKHMCYATKLANVGPMAAVAGAISQYVGFSLLDHTDEVILENGGDIFLKSNSTRDILVFAGSSPFSNKLALKIPISPEGIGICTSSGTVGHSLSFGKADAVVVVSKDTLIADAAATAIGNVVKSESHIAEGLSFGKSIPTVQGILIIAASKMGAWGDIEMIRP